MKLKGIKPVEQHFEKLIVVALAAVFMLVLLMQFAIHPNMVDVGMPAQQYGPGSAYGPVEKRALKLSADMSRPDPEMPEEQTVDIASGFEEGIHGGVSPRPRLAMLIPGRPITGGENVNFDEIGRNGAQFARLVVPAPTGLITGSVTNTLSPIDVQRIDGLAELVAAQQPYDKNVITVEGIFDGAALREVLRTDPDGVGEIMPFRSNWWNNKIQIIGVVLEREELTESGEWTGLKTVPAIPGAFSLIEGIESNVRSTGALESLAERAFEKNERNLILQPPYYLAMAGREWKPPAQIAEDNANSVDQVKIDVFLSRLERAEKKLEDVIELKEEREQETGIVMQSFVRQVERREEEVEELKDELRRMGHIFEDDEEDDRSRDDAEDAKPMLEDDAIRIWAHDLTAEPGATYRYRLGVVLNNPLFGRHAALQENQKDLANNPLAVSEMSTWSGDVDVDRMEYFFVTSASGGSTGGLGGRNIASGAKATVDVFRFYYGFWRRGSTGLKPGDVVMAEVANPKDLFTFDYDSAPKDKTTGLLLPEALKPLEFDEDGNPVDPPEWFVPVEPKLAADLDAQFLDVSRVPGEVGSGIGGVGASKTKYQAVLSGGADSQLFVRNPTSEKMSDQYLRLVRSAKLGETQGQPVVKEKEETGLPPQEDLRGPSIAPPGGGGGG